MVQIGYEDTGGGDYGEPIRYDLGHEKRYTGTIAEVSGIQEMEFKYDDEPQERLVISFRTSFDDLDVDEETRDELQEYVQSEIQDREDQDLQVDHPEDAIELVMICTAKVTPAVGENYSASKLYSTLKKLGLAEADGDGQVTLLNREGEQADVFEGVGADPEEMNRAFTDYLQKNLTGMEVEYEVSNAKRGTEDEYSSVGKVIDLVNDPQTE